MRLKGNVNRGLLEPLISPYGYHLSVARSLTGLHYHEQTADGRIAEVDKCTQFEDNLVG